MYHTADSTEEADHLVTRFQADFSSLEKELEGFHPQILGLMPKAKDILPVWKLQDRDPLPTWCRGRLLLVGDAAHPMLPNQGQGTWMDEISERMKNFEDVRRPRASLVQLVSRYPYYVNGVEVIKDRLIEYMAADELPPAGNPNDMRRWLFNLRS
ncbi:hypothetical protein BDV96DRAFT_649313 [Lophiotrema nucula]|uniref:FAD-binding domain-containing protein n=1 Tax=Lophiotrema nucula TaxID=690887 RepID=A0A6A5YXR7_9PLEO|nr:hypothetical protein BDV96DRAFT_649313 [Lophiotrema nucula]